MTLSKIQLKSSFQLVLAGLCIFLCSFSLETEDEFHTEKKADFILEIAQNIEHKNADASLYKIAVYGKSKEVRLLFEELELRSINLKIHGKDVQILQFKREKNIEACDILYLPSESKVSLADIEGRMNGYPYLLITENFPFGSSSLNFAVNENNELYYEVQEDEIEEKGMDIKSSFLKSEQRVSSKNLWKEKFERALKTIDAQGEIIGEQEKTIGNQEMVLGAQDRAIDKQETEITEHKEKLVESEDVIRLQRVMLVFGIIALLIIGGLFYSAIRLNRARKAAIIQVEEQKNHIESQKGLVEKKNRNIIQSINYAKRIQRAVLPSGRRLNKMFPVSSVFYLPKDIIGGDFYWIQKADKKLFFAVGDCTGHGVPGAMLSVLCSNWLTQTVKELRIFDPAEVLDHIVVVLERYLSAGEEELKDGMDISLCTWDVDTNMISYAGANNALYYVRNGELEEVIPDKQPVGKYADRVPFETKKFKLEEGDRFYLFSDGFMDQFGGPRGKKLTSLGFKKLIMSVQDLPVTEQAAKMEEEYHRWKGEKEQIDDVCVLVVQL